MRRVWTLLAVLGAFALLTGTALAHPERQAFFPDPNKGAVPEPRRAQQEAADRLQVELASGSSRRSSRARSGAASGCSAWGSTSSAASATSRPRSTTPRATTASRSCRALYREEPSRKVPVDQPQCAAMFETPDDGDAPVPNFEHQVKCPNSRNLIAIIGDSLADPDRECDHKCNLLMEGLGRKPQGRQDRGRPAEEGRHPRRPRRRLLPPQRVGRAGRVQRRRRRRDQRLPPAGRSVAPYAQNYGVLTFASDHGLYDAHRGVRQRRLGHLPGLRARGPLQALRDRDPQRQLPRQRARLLGHRGQRHLDARLERSTTTTPASPTTRSRPGHPGMPQDCSKWDAQPGLLEQPELLHERPRHVLQEHAVREAPNARSCARSSRCPVGSGFILYGVNSNLIQDNRDLRQLALGRAPVLGAGGDPRRQRPRARSSTPRTATSSSATRWACGPTASATPTASTSSGTRRARATAGGGNPAARRQGHERPGVAARLPRHGLVHAVATRRRRAAEVPCAPWDPDDQPGSARLHLVHDAAEALLAMKVWLALGVLLLAGVGALLLLGDRDGGPTQAAHRHRAAAVEGEAEPDPRAVDAAGPHPHRPAAQRLAALRRPRHRDGADPRRQGPRAALDRRCSRSTSRTASTRGRGT